MATAALIPDQASANGILDQVFGAATSAVDLYAKLNQTKNPPPVGNASVQGSATTAATPSAGGFNLDSKTMLIGGAVIGGIILIIALTRK